MINIDANLKNADWPKRTDDTFVIENGVVKITPKRVKKTEPKSAQ
jgi:hypothetical protein